MNQQDASEELCYICAELIAQDSRSMEHVVPRGLFNPEDRQNLITLPAHRECNQRFAKDDERFRLYVTARAPYNDKAKKLWSGPVMRGLHRPRSKGFKTSILRNLMPVDIRSPTGLYLGTADAMLQEPETIHRVVNRITRGLYTRRTGKVLPTDWPVSSDMMPTENLKALEEAFGMRFFEVGNGTFYYGSKHLDDDREALFGLLFYGAVHFWAYTGDRLRRMMPWGDEQYEAQTAI